MNKKLKVVSKIHRKKRKKEKQKARMQTKQAKEMKALASAEETKEVLPAAAGETQKSAGHEPVVSRVERPGRKK